MSISKPPTSPAIPFLEPGDRLGRDEFERRYQAMPHIKKAELIEGVVYMPSPVRHHAHAEPHSYLMTWLGTYTAFTPCVRSSANGTVRLDLKNVPQPDAMLFLKPECGGRAKISKDDYVEDAPELVAEVAASSAGYDLYTKKTVYLRNGVREYVVWRVLDGAIDWFAAKGNEFVPLAPDAASVLRSEFFPGLWLDTAALLRGDLAAVLTVLQSGLASSEHAAFLRSVMPPGNSPIG